MKFDNQLRYAASIVQAYDGSVPLAAWLKDFYKANKQMGSSDRRTVSQMVYGYYRLGFNNYSNVEERILAGIKAAGQLPDLLAYFEEKGMVATETITHFSKIFPWTDELSDGMDVDAFARSFIIQPDLFLRIRSGYQGEVLDKLTKANVPFSHCGINCISVSNATKIDSILEVNREVVIQDRSSQRTGDLINNLFDSAQVPEVWDCCAASGGKSIMINDLFKKTELTVSDIRNSILHNLRKRFAEAGINNYHAFESDLTASDTNFPQKSYDLIVADVPCTGSGTWARTPEQLFFFDKQKIGYYQQKQMKIVSRVAPQVKKGGFLLYITCSVFKKENEEIIQFISNNTGLTLVKNEVLTGYNEKADTLFAALFTNSSA